MVGSQSYNFTVKSSIKDYDVIFSKLEDLNLDENDIVIRDKNIEFDHENSIVINSTERHKEYSYIFNVINEIMERGFKRNNKLVAIGGGVVQDMTGFVASMLYRGVDWVFCPTTLLSQGDSCIGAKTSINVGKYKNIVGNFYPPSKVIIDTSLLDGLPESQILSGIGEMAHYFFIDGRKSFEYFRDNFKDPNYEDMIHKSLYIKKKMIEIDEFDRKERKIFNYGHTFGHAIESITKYEIPHGIAVSYGMIISNVVSYRLGYLDKEEMKEMNSVLFDINKKLLPDFDFESYLKILKQDKKNEGSNLGLILTRGLGDMFIQQTDPNLVVDYIKEGLDICRGFTIIDLTDRYEKEIIKEGLNPYYTSLKETIVYANPINTGKKCTFIMALKNRNDRAITSINSLIKDDTLNDFNYIIVEDMYNNNDPLEIEDQYKDHIQHIKVNTGVNWNKSVLLNIGLKYVTTPSFCMWDADFVFPNRFSRKLSMILRDVDIKNQILSLPCFETHQTYNIGKLYEAKQSYGGLWIYPTEKVNDNGGFNEKIENWGFEEIELKKKLEKNHNVKTILTYHYYDIMVFHYSHGDNLRVIGEDNSHFIDNKNI